VTIVSWSVKQQLSTTVEIQCQKVTKSIL